MQGAASAPLAGHDHAWHLTVVDFEEHGAVSTFECAGCSAVRFE